MTEPDPTVPTHGYLLDNRAHQAGARFDNLAGLFNPVTFRHLQRLGIAPGWRCWEVGVGGPTIPRWLAQQVGPSGHVLATDIDTSWATDEASDIVSIRRHDVVDDPPPGSDFDLVHARLVLLHLPARQQVVRTMVAALRRGGWILVEDFDSELVPLACIDAFGPQQQQANRVRAGFRRLLTDRGADLAYARRLPRLLRDAGLVDVAADAFFSVATPESTELENANIGQVRDQIVEVGYATKDEVDGYLAALDAGTVDVGTAPLISCWGRRP